MHPSNVLLPRSWLEESSEFSSGESLNWFEWISFTRSGHAGKAEFRISPRSILDYRFVSLHKQGICSGMHVNDWERRLATIGFILLGLVRKSFETPRIWNIRGHEKIHRVPRTQWYEVLKISSQGLLLIESCLSTRCAETRTMSRTPTLFGIGQDKTVNDTNYDPPLLESLDQLYKEIEKVQRVLTENQLSVSLNQPRQLIPFKLRDFSVGTGQEDDSDADTI